ncbi:MAG: hypothetical protein HY347_01515 [candidate division NC10 bacterium]|nr:hypothetical protein [candidate division NC10 bacterium]
MLSFPFFLLQHLLSLHLPPFSIVGGTLAALGALYGVSRPISRFQAARLADARLGLKERLATALEVLESGEGGEVAAALLGDAAKTAQTISAKKVFPFRPLQEGRFLLLFVLVFFLLPPLPFQRGAGENGAKETSPSRGVEELKDEKGSKTEDIALGPDASEPPSSPRGFPSKREPWGELPTLFKDTKLEREKLSFQGFLQEADERLKLLGDAKTLPSSAQQASTNPSRVALRQGKEPPQGKPQALNKPPGPSKDDLGQLFQAMKDLNGELGPSSQDLAKSQQAPQETGQARESKDPSEGAKRTVQEGGERLSKSLQGIPEQESTSRKEGAPEKGQGPGKKGDPSPGLGKAPDEQGEPTPRKMEGPSLKIDEPKRKLALAGQTREQGIESFETELLGEGARGPSHLPYLDVLAQYRRMMEEEIQREAIPFDYREQVKRYFLSLEEAVRKTQSPRGERK